ncbi:putative fluoride ion transporter CrcB [Candidatus Desulfarcum epimagneticum]|uniref:Fluoride-specific ion channel FluC n=1 Tax=uncultured Desulfobacteraceae bacterium TaxID=218296 RepID=A0A484HHK9_9BACT|nr:putative fluoride ion transporter CrcB [uncultured Desulfobacteraceae bacterium]
MSKLLLIGIGGFAGSILRHLVSGLFARMFENPWFPHGTLAVNAIGCFLIGLLGGLFETGRFLTPEARLVLLVGFLGGFTTFSAFGYELFAAGRDGRIMGAFMNFALHMTLGFSGVALGFKLSRAL